VRSAKAALYRRAFAACDAVLFQNTDDLQELERCGAVTAAMRPRVHMVAGSGVDLTEFPQVQVPEGAHFLMIARPLREKGLAEYVEAARLVAQDVPAATFTWMGPMRDANPSAIDADTLRRWLREGPVRHVDEQADVRPSLAACSVFVLPSHREGTSKVVLEAMATGRAIITTDAPGCGHLVTHENGVAVPVGDVQALANAMRTLARDATRRVRMGEGARTVATARFDAAKVNAACLRALTGAD
jgi:glycosyltransferase involved in cell wall biosynthesis